MNNLIKLTLAAVFTFSIAPAFAVTVTTAYNDNSSPSAVTSLTSDGSDGALLEDNSLTLAATNNQKFNYTTINLGAGSILDFSGVNSGDSVFILGIGDFRLDGIINLPSLTSFTFETTGNIYLDGSMLSFHSNLSFISQSFYGGSNSIITDSGGSIYIYAGDGVVTNNGKFDLGAPPPYDISIGNGGGIALNPSPITVVPEPTSYALLLAGLGLIGFVTRRTQS